MSDDLSRRNSRGSRLQTSGPQSLSSDNQQSPVQQPVNPKPVQSIPQKELKQAVGSLYKEGEPRVIEHKEFVVPKEVKPWVEKIDKE